MMQPDTYLDKFTALERLFDSIDFDDPTYGDDWEDIPEDTDEDDDIGDEEEKVLEKELGEDIKLSVKAVIFNEEGKFLILQDSNPIVSKQLNPPVLPGQIEPAKEIETR